jgi:hypothetical protein
MDFSALSREFLEEMGTEVLFTQEDYQVRGFNRYFSV